MSQLVVSLIITVVGMGLVFVAIMLLWGLMEIIVRMTAKSEEEIPEEGGTAPIPSTVQTKPSQDKKQRAAAAAVAFALAVRQRGGAVGAAVAPERELSAWQAASLAIRINQRASVLQRR